MTRHFGLSEHQDMRCFTTAVNLYLEPKNRVGDIEDVENS
jgi:hypothetical protein